MRTNHLARYDYEDRLEKLRIAMGLNVALGLIILFATKQHASISSNAILALVSGIGIGLFAISYDWSNKLLNTGLILSYFAFAFYELFYVGSPAALITGHGPETAVGKGILLDLFLYTLPGIYLALRVCLGIPLLLMTKFQQ